MKLDKLYYFESAARNNSFTMAAKEFHIAQSAVSQQIKILEKELGFSLFERLNNKKIVLTPSGEIFYDKVVQIISLYKDAVNKARIQSDYCGNTLTLGLCEARSVYNLHCKIKELKDRYPQIEIQLKELKADECFSEIINRHCDAIFCLDDLLNSYDNTLDSKIINYSEFGVLISKTSPLSDKPFINFDDLIGVKSPIYILNTYEKNLIQHIPKLKNIIKTKPNMNLLCAYGYINDGIIITTYEECKSLIQDNMIFKKFINYPINTLHSLYYLKNNNNWILSELLQLLSQ